MKQFNFFFLSIFLFIDCFAGSLSCKVGYYDSLISADLPLRQRILTTICCDDCNALPKVENAGETYQGLDNTKYQLMHNGIKVVADCYYGKWMTEIIRILKGHHEPQEERVFHEVLKHISNNAVMIELGSYWGYYSMWFQQRVVGAKNYLIEPDPKNLIIGQNNFKMNNMTGFFIQAMIGESTKEGQIFTDWDYNQHCVKQICIDDFAKEHNISFIDILHSDIQGAEIDMLKGCQNLIAEHRIGYFFISTHRGTHMQCLDILKAAHLKVIVSITREESFSADGLIVAKLPELEGPNNIDITLRTNEFCSLVDGVMQK